MTDKFHHVLGAIGDRQTEVLFSDLTARELRKQFVIPYMRGITFFAGTAVVAPAELRKVRIIETPVNEAKAREQVNRDSLAHIAEINRTSGLFIISPGQGHQPDDIEEAGDDVTRTFLHGGPGSASVLLGLSKNAAGWLLGIVGSVLAAGLAKWLDWV